VAEGLRAKKPAQPNAAVVRRAEKSTIPAAAMVAVAMAMMGIDEAGANAEAIPVVAGLSHAVAAGKGGVARKTCAEQDEGDQGKFFHLNLHSQGKKTP
jgi:hypothetical protein